jgi:hypothetical protein
MKIKGELKLFISWHRLGSRVGRHSPIYSKYLPYLLYDILGWVGIGMALGY